MLIYIIDAEIWEVQSDAQLFLVVRKSRNNTRKGDWSKIIFSHTFDLTDFGINDKFFEAFYV